MNILIVGVKNNPQLDRLVEEGEKRGHKVTGCLSSELTIIAQNDKFEATLREKPLTEYDLFYLWAYSKRRWEWLTALDYLKRKNKFVVVNQKVLDPSYLYLLSPAADYLKQYDDKLPFPKSAILSSPKSVSSVLSNFEFPLIVKRAAGRQGKGVFKVESKEGLIKSLEDLPQGNPNFVIREFIPNDGDIRVFTVGYKAIGAMKRTPKEGDFRSNISQGGSGAKFDLESNPEVRKLAEHLSEVTRTEVAGVDIILHSKTKKPYILEINPGPQFTGFEEYTGGNAAGEIIKYFETLL